MPKLHPEAALPAVPSIAVLLTSFNRCVTTLEALHALHAQSVRVARTMHVILVDDGSRDGTAEAVASRFPGTEVLRGAGALFWNRGMRKAFARAQELGFDYYLLLNDDTILAPHCLDTLLQTAQRFEQQGKPSIVTATTCDAITGLRSYGGSRRLRQWSGVKDVPVEPLPDSAVLCDTMNGNCTLIPAAVVAAIGILDESFHHHFGDYDYGFRATAAGFAVHAAPGFLGTCSKNADTGTWRDSRVSFRKRWKHLMSPKGVPIKEWFLFSRRHNGYLWPLYFLSPYVKVGLSLFSPGERKSVTTYVTTPRG